MDNRENILLRIANTLMVYAYHITENGLMHGKTGAMLYMYLYAHHSGSDACYDFAGELLDGLMKSTADAPVSFEDGIAGLGWCVGRLMQADIIGGNPNAVLAPMDRRLIDASSQGRWSESWNELIYFADRLQDTPLRTGEQKDACALVLAYLQWQIKEKSVRLSAERRRAVTHFIRSYEAIRGKSKTTTELRKLINIPLNINQKNIKTYTAAQPHSVETLISRALWQRIFNDPDISPLPKTEELLSFTENLQKGLAQEDLTLSKGLAGLGTVVLFT